MGEGGIENHLKAEENTIDTLFCSGNFCFFRHLVFMLLGGAT